jgi:hypothetical protein
MKLAAISGVNGPFTDADIRRVRRLALAARAGKTTRKSADRRRSSSTGGAGSMRPKARTGRLPA